MNNSYKKLMLLSIQVLVLSLVLVFPSFADMNPNLTSFDGFDVAVDGNTITASYDKEANVLTIKGSGTLDANKWVELAKKIHPENYTFGSDHGWSNNSNITMEFVADEGKMIHLSNPYYYDFYYHNDEQFEGVNGLFQNYRGEIHFNDCVDIEGVIDMQNMFTGAINFHEDISKWDTSNVENMINLFSGTTFNGDISNWDVSNVKYIMNAFGGNSEFSGDLSKWNTKNVINMRTMFAGAKSFNADISKWDVSKVKYFYSMFYQATSFTGDLSDWDMSSTVNAGSMFYNVPNVSFDVSKWRMPNLEYMGAIFTGTKFKNMNFLNLGNLAEMKYDTCFFHNTNPDFVGFENYSQFTWENIPSDYWVSEDGKPFVKESLAGKDKVFKKGLKYILEKKIMPHISVDKNVGTYSENADPITIDDFKGLTSKDILGNDIEGTWSLDLKGYNGTDVGDHVISLTFTPSDTDKYQTVSQDIEITMAKAKPDVDAPTGLKVRKGQRLKEIALPKVEGGVWQFKDPEAVVGGQVGEQEFEIIFIPTSPNYGVLETTVKVEVKAKSSGSGSGNTGSTGSSGGSGGSGNNGSGEVIDDEVTPEASGEIPFDDVNENDWYYDSVKSNFLDGTLMGTSDTTFEPKLNVTRGMMITVIYRINNELIDTVGMTFPDVVKDSYYEKAVSWGAENNVVKGYGVDYKPNKKILRQEMVAMLYRYYSNKYKGTLTTDEKALDVFKDKDEVSEYAQDAMKWAVSNKLMKGRAVDALAPKEDLTRAELAVIISRFKELTK